MSDNNSNSTPALLWVLIFFFPVIGIIYLLVSKKTKDMDYKKKLIIVLVAIAWAAFQIVGQQVAATQSKSAAIDFIGSYNI